MKNSIKITNALFLAAILMVTCTNPTTENQSMESEVGGAKQIAEAREDSIKLNSAYKLQSKIQAQVFPVVETNPVDEGVEEDAADDPAIWYNVNHPEQSRVYGSNKVNGIYSYDLKGNETSFYPYGLINNIDVRQDVLIGNEQYDIIGGSNRTDNSIVISGIDSTGNLFSLLAENFVIDTSDIDEVYGFSLYKNDQKELFAIVNGKNGKINQYQLMHNVQRGVYLDFVNSWNVSSQPEGMVADDIFGVLYVGEEEKGIWKISLNDSTVPMALLPESQSEVNSDIVYDIEGLSIYYGENDSGFLLASIQGSFSYALFDRNENNYLGSFSIKDAGGIDGVEETDGLDIYSSSIGLDFPDGLLVVQDGFNYENEKASPQNFKLVNLSDVLTVVDQFQ